MADNYQKNFGIGSFGDWTGNVVSVDDPIKAGRVQVRIFGYHDDKTNVPDKDLPWVYPSTPITSASVNHIGVSPTGLIVGSTVGGHFQDAHQLIPVMTRSIPRSQIEQPQGMQYSQPSGSNTSYWNDVSPNARGVQKVEGEDPSSKGKDYSTPIEQAIPDKANDGSKDKALKYPKAISPDLKTIAETAFKDAPNILNLIQQIDPKNLAGSIPNAIQAMTGMKNLTSIEGLISAVGGGQLQQILQTLQQDASQLQAIAQTLSNPQQLEQVAIQAITSMLQGQSPFKDGIASFNAEQGKLKMILDMAKKAFN